MPTPEKVQVAIIGAGIAGISAAYHLIVKGDCTSVALIDSRQPMSYTTAQSGDNYRNWWPHQTMTDFTNDSIELMERFAQDSGNAINMTKRGYLLATRQASIDAEMDNLYTGYGDKGLIRTHINESSMYEPPIASDQFGANGVDVLSNRALIQKHFPSLSHKVNHLLHIRHAGDFSSQQLGQLMLEKIKAAGGHRLMGDVTGIEVNSGFDLCIDTADGTVTLKAERIVNAAGPFVNDIAAMLETPFPIDNVFHQKIAFEDERSAIPRDLPFCIDLDEKSFDWTEEEQQWLSSEPELSWLTKPVGGGTHCRPEGGDHGTWVKLGWAYNQTVSDKPQADLHNDPRRDSHFPEIVMRAAAQLQPSLEPYVTSFPKRWTHYGGYYSMTKENWPLIGPTQRDGVFVIGALSGFGCMAACAAGSLIANQVLEQPVPDYAAHLGLTRYQDNSLMAQLNSANNKGLL